MTPDPFDEHDEFVRDRYRLFRRTALGFAALVAALVLFSTYWMMGPDSYHEHLATIPPGEAWPDGSPRDDRPAAPELAPPQSPQ
jgi:hypothetical protein